MTSIPFLSLASITIDEALARRLPRQIAIYHRALPIAEDGDAITVIMAQPGTHYVVRMLETVLNAPVVLVRGDENEIRAELDNLYPHGETSGQMRVLSDGGGALASAITEWVGGELTVLDSARASIEDVIAVANAGQFDATVVAIPDHDAMSALLRRLNTTLVLRRQPPEQPISLRRCLCVMRGHAPDEILLYWMTRLARASRAEIILLAIADSGDAGGRRLAALLSTEHEMGAHVSACAGRLAAAGIPGSLKLRHGNAIEQIAVEVAIGDYDLLAVAVEAYGDFVQQVIAALDRLPPDKQVNLFLSRPSPAL